jgi:hypothetical protein
MVYFIKPCIFYLTQYVDLDQSNGIMMKSLTLPAGMLRRNLLLPKLRVVFVEMYI